MSRGRLAAVILLGLVALALAAPVLITSAPDTMDLAHRRRRRHSPTGSAPTSSDAICFTRVLFGARVSLAVGLLSALVSGALALRSAPQAAWPAVPWTPC
jgi:ABC-type dipeptide/oligopeptide/nickel transport system permease subunit